MSLVFDVTISAGERQELDDNDVGQDPSNGRGVDEGRPRDHA